MQINGGLGRNNKVECLEGRMIALIVAFAKNQVIGNKGCIPWEIKGEQKRFRELTTGNVVIMGRRSYLAWPLMRRA